MSMALAKVSNITQGGYGHGNTMCGHTHPEGVGFTTTLLTFPSAVDSPAAPR